MYLTSLHWIRRDIIIFVHNIKRKINSCKNIAGCFNRFLTKVIKTISYLGIF